MKIGMAISAAILLVLGLILFVKTRPTPPDAPSGSITDAVLEAQSLPADLPRFGVSAGEREDDGGALFEAVEASRAMLRTGGYEDEKRALAIGVTDELERAARANLAEGVLDRRIPANQFESQAVEQFAQALNTAVTTRINDLIEQGDFDDAPLIAASYLAFGRQMFERNLRLKARQRGLLTMKSALVQVRKIATAAEEDGALEPEEVQAINADVQRWFDAITSVESAWNAKLKTTESTSSDAGIPNIADLIRIAEEDRDRTFRVWAALRLGYARFERGSSGNQRAISRALDTLEQSDDPLVAAAAKAGRAIPDAEAYHQLR